MSAEPTRLTRRTLLRAGLAAGLSACTPADDPTSASPSAAPAPSAPAAPTTAASPDGASPPPAPSASPTPTPEPRVVTAIGRDALGLPPAREGGRPHRITGLVVHHTAAPTTTADRTPDRLRSLTAGHRNRGWVDAAYHWGVGVDGTVYQLRDPATAGDTATDYDPAGWLLVVCEGNFEVDEPPPAMLDALADVLAAGIGAHGLDPARPGDDLLVGHRDLAATLCPGAGLHDRLGALRDVVATRVASGGVVLDAVDDPALVAAVEAG